MLTDAHQFGNTVLTAAWEPLVVDLAAPQPGVSWSVGYIAAKGLFAAVPLVAPYGNTPISGLFLVQVGASAPLDTLAGGVDIREARAIPLACDWFVSQLAAPQNAFACIWRGYGARLTVPQGWAIRFIASPNPATAQPGPGAGSYANVAVQGFIDRSVRADFNRTTGMTGRS